ncbi:MAG: hemolysin III family protein [Erysipelotrichales bacterium]|nr:hemolysin III family protein [Erysipelotrichales bacterium]
MSLDELKTLKLPNYTEGEEKFNWMSHAIGICAGVIILIICLSLAIYNNHNANSIVSLIIYGLSMCAVYFISTIYHSSKPLSFNKRLRRVLDHCTIYLLIAGTYTPLCIIAFSSNIEGIILLILEWALAIGGIILTSVWFNSKIAKVISFIFYIILGWAIMFFPSLIEVLSPTSFLFILIGGITYTLGSILYGIGHSKTYFHCIFHVFCLLGTLIQAIGIIVLL